MKELDKRNASLVCSWLGLAVYVSVGTCSNAFSDVRIAILLGTAVVVATIAATAVHMRERSYRRALRSTERSSENNSPPVFWSASVKAGMPAEMESSKSA